MTSSAEQNLASLGITLPEAPSPAANYVPYVIVGDMVYVSGQVPFVNGGLQVPARLAVLSQLSRLQEKPVFVLSI